MSSGTNVTGKVTVSMSGQRKKRVNSQIKKFSPEREMQ